MGKKQFSIATRYDRALAKEENATIARVNTRLEQAFSSINGELTTYYENLQGEGSLTAQMRVRRSEELKTVLTRIDPSRGAQYEREFEQLITTATQTGRTLGDELLTSYQSDLVGQFTNIPYQAIAAQARDGAIRLSKHTEAFQDKASAVIEMGLVQGKSSKWMQRELRNQLGVTKSKAESIARTESASAFNTAAQARYKAGGVDGIQVMITPSDRVCPFCAARNGNVYKHGAIAVPFHVRCRCVTIPWDSSWQRLGLTDDEFVKDYRDKGLKDLRSLGLQPDYGLAPFERANKVKNVPVAIWKPGEAVLNPTKKIVAPKPKPAPTPPPQPAPAPSPEPIQPAPQPVAPPAPTPAPIPSAAKMPGAKTIQGVKERKLPQIKGQKDFETYLRAHAADLDETYNRGGIISLVELEQRMSLHGVKPETFRAALLDAFDDSFSLGNNSSNPAYMVNGLERNTLTIINKSKFTDKKTLAELEQWHKSLKGATTGEIIDSFDGFRQAAGDFIDKAAPMNGNLTEIHQVRRNLGDRVTRREFNEWMRELQEKDLIQLMGGSLTNASPENLADSIRGANGGARFYAKKLNLNEKLNVSAPAKAAVKPKAAAKVASKAKATATAAKVEFPTDLADLDFVDDLGGSTGAQLVKDRKTGQLFVRKLGASEDHLREEFAADELYRAMGVPVPRGRLYETAGRPVKLTEYIEGKSLKSLKGKQRKDAIAKIQENFTADALLGNWDVIGMAEDNVLIGKDGTVFRIDNGGALRYRAMGAFKGDAWNSVPLELSSIRELNPKVFGSVTVEDIAKQGKALKAQQKSIKAAIAKYPDLEKTLGDRLDAIIEIAEAQENLLKAGVPQDKAELILTNSLKLKDSQAKASLTAAANKATKTKPALGNRVFGASDHGVEFDAAKYAEAVGVTKREANKRFKAIYKFTDKQYTAVRDSQRKGRDNPTAQAIEAYLSTAKPYKGQIHRGMILDSNDEFYKIVNGGKVGAEFTEVATNSWSSSKPVSENFAAPSSKPDGKRISVMFSVQNKTGASIRNASKYTEELEVLVPKNAKYRIVSIEETDYVSRLGDVYTGDGYNRFNVMLEEVIEPEG